MGTFYHLLDTEALIQLRTAHERNLTLLAEQAAKSGLLHTTLPIQNQIDDERQKIEAINEELAKRTRANFVDQSQSQRSPEEDLVVHTPSPNPRPTDPPIEVLAGIRKRAAERFSNNFSTQKYQINTEVQAWKGIQRFEADDVPSEVLEVIKEKASMEFSRDFSTQLYQIRKEVDAWRDMQKLTALDIPTAILEPIIDRAVTEFRDNFSVQLYQATREIDAWRKLQE